MFQIDMLPARYGDCLWIEYGDESAPHRILIDGGKAGTYKAIQKKCAAVRGDCVLELLVVTHIDCDHIDGIVKLLQGIPSNLKINEIWFNGWDQIAPHRLGGPAGEYLTHSINLLGLAWNSHFGGSAVMVNEDGTLPVVDLPGGMRLTVLSPTHAELAALVPVWEEECIAAGILPGSAPAKPKIVRKRRLGETVDVRALAAEDFEEDTSHANGSTIAFLAEYDGKSCLFAGDAHPSVITESIRTGLGKSRIAVDAYKIAHHGSKNNTSPELVEMVRTTRYLVSTNGAIYKHPDGQALARILTGKSGDAHFYFNYKNDQKYEGWQTPLLKSRWRFSMNFPPSGAGIQVRL